MPRQWSFIADMNFDGAVTISDAWLWLKWLFFYPGDLLFYVLMTSVSPVARFLELSQSSYGGWSSGIISAITWLIACSVIAFLLGAALSSSSAHRTPSMATAPKSIWSRKLPWWAGIAVLVPLYALLTYCTVR
jgi:uncharacterized iron-regulated membrane protein